MDKKIIRNPNGEIKWAPVLSELKIDWKTHAKRVRPFEKMMDRAHERSVKQNLAYRANQHQR